MKKKLVTIGTATALLFTSTISISPNTIFAERNMNQLKSEQSELNTNLTKVEQKIKDILLEMNAINDKIVGFEAEIKENKKAIKKVKKQMDKHEKEIDAINERIDERNEILKNRISSMQQVGGNVSLLEVFLGAKSPIDFLSRVEAVTTMTKADQKLIDEQEADLQKVEEKMGELEQIKADHEGIIDQIEYSMEEQKKSKKKLKKKEKELKREKSNIEGSLQTVNSELARLEAQVRQNIDRGTSAQTISNTATASNNQEKASSSPKVKVNNSSVLSTAYSASGTPYKVAGTDKSGFDCSGFVQWVYKQHGVNLPRTAAAMGGTGQRVSKLSEAQPGDLVLFRNGKHVGIYIGNGKFIGSQTSTGVAVASLTSGYWAKEFDGNIRRVR